MALCFRLFALSLLLATQSAPQIPLRDAVDSALAGSTVFLEPTVYSGPANCDVQIQKDLTLLSNTSSTIIDCLGVSRCLTVSGGASVTIIGVTFINGNTVPSNTRSATSISIQTSLHSRKVKKRIHVIFIGK